MGTAEAQGTVEAQGNTNRGSHLLRKSVAHILAQAQPRAAAAIITPTMASWPESKHGFLSKEGVNCVLPGFC